ncbi:outer membrane beta-barrel protein [Mariniflexile maritimum]|jgi:hypothetical protein|uniref:outer membrane beta-barrel protein n=1 Tax=Mariniflexile maritimum TaxID=2682493 RepID=UPI0012F6FB39|nr:outer membrane beta-barrel protein [Mariniflexile maritimum]
MKNLLLALLFVGVSVSASAQGKFFLKAGLGNYTVKDEGLNENTFGINIGMGFHFGQTSVFQPELNFGVYKLDISNSGNDGILFEDYTYNGSVFKLSIPLLFKQLIADKISLIAGITPSMLFINKDKMELTRINGGYDKSSFATIKEISANGAFTFGGEYSINDRLILEARYNFTPIFFTELDGFNIVDTSEFKLYESRSIQLGLKYIVR